MIDGFADAETGTVKDDDIATAGGDTAGNDGRIGDSLKVRRLRGDGLAAESEEGWRVAVHGDGGNIRFHFVRAAGIQDDCQRHGAGRRAGRDLEVDLVRLHIGDGRATTADFDGDAGELLREGAVNEVSRAGGAGAAGHFKIESQDTGEDVRR